MTILRMDNVGIVLDDLGAAVAFLIPRLIVAVDDLDDTSPASVSVEPSSSAR